jgi:hypothetical protein
VLAFYRDRFSNAAGATFVFVAPSPRTMRPLVEKYLRSLPTTAAAQWRDRFTRRRASTRTAQGHRAAHDAHRFRAHRHGRHTTVDGDSATDALLQNHLRDALRETWQSLQRRRALLPVVVPVENMRSSSSSARAAAPTSSRSEFAEIAALQTEGPTAAAVATVREGLLRQYETNSRQRRVARAAGRLYQFERIRAPLATSRFPVGDR